MTSPGRRPKTDWPILRHYDATHLRRIALPLGGIGTGTVSLGGRGNLLDWEIMNRPAKGFTPHYGQRSLAPFFAIRVADPKSGKSWSRALEGAIPPEDYEGAFGCAVPNHGLPRFPACSFSTAYPLGQVHLSDRALPVTVRLEAFNPLIPGDPDTSGIPAAILRFAVRNPTSRPLQAALCGTLVNPVGATREAPASNPEASGLRAEYRDGHATRGLVLSAGRLDAKSESWGTLALATTAPASGLTFRRAWAHLSWGDSLLDFWDDFTADGRLEDRALAGKPDAMASLCVPLALPPRSEVTVTFLVTWHFPNRYTWTPAKKPEGACASNTPCAADRIGNYYTKQYADAWDVAEQTAPRLAELEAQTVGFVRAFCESDLPKPVREAALFNLSTLRSQTCFRTPDGRFYGWEGCGDNSGCCHGSCTHVWNYEVALPFLFGSLSRSMREVSFARATDDRGLMSFRTNLPIGRGSEWKLAAADGQLGSLMRLHLDWRLSGDTAWLRGLWPKARKAMEFCWIPGGWDADRDGVMEGCQHNTMDVEYFGPNPQMGIWYLGALRAVSEMASAVGEPAFAQTCAELAARGRAWIDSHLFNGEYYEHEVRPIPNPDRIAPGLRIGMGASELSDPALQLGAGCLVDQLVGQYMAHICGLGHVIDPAHARQTLRSILKHNRRTGFTDHFNHLRSFVMGDESALLMATYPKGRRPKRPFPYYNEVMTGFEYTAAVGMIYEGLKPEGLGCIQAVRERYDGRKRSPFNEAECGHHYARAMASWAAVPALTGFQYDGPARKMTFGVRKGRFFWSTGDAWGTVELKPRGKRVAVTLRVLHGTVSLERFAMTNVGEAPLRTPGPIRAGEVVRVTV